MNCGLRAEKRHQSPNILATLFENRIWRRVDDVRGLVSDMDGKWINIETEHQKGESGSVTRATFERVLRMVIENVEP